MMKSQERRRGEEQRKEGVSCGSCSRGRGRVAEIEAIRDKVKEQLEKFREMERYVY